MREYVKPTREDLMQAAIIHRGLAGYVEHAQITTIARGLAKARNEAWERAAKWHESRAEVCDEEADIASTVGDAPHETRMRAEAKVHRECAILYTLRRDIE